MDVKEETETITKQDYFSDNSVSLPGLMGQAGPVGFEPGMFKSEDPKTDQGAVKVCKSQQKSASNPICRQLKKKKKDKKKHKHKHKHKHEHKHGKDKEKRDKDPNKARIKEETLSSSSTPSPNPLTATETL